MDWFDKITTPTTEKGKSFWGDYDNWEKDPRKEIERLEEFRKSLTSNMTEDGYVRAC